MFKQCCGKCGECWWIGNPRTCTCPDETPKRTWVGLTKEEKHEFRYSHMTTADFIDAIEAKLKDKNTRG